MLHEKTGGSVRDDDVTRTRIRGPCGGNFRLKGVQGCHERQIDSRCSYIVQHAEEGVVFGTWLVLAIFENHGSHDGRLVALIRF